MRAHLDDADLAAAARYERRFRHDVMAHVHAFGDQAPAARPYLHLGATSAFVTDNADLIVMRDGLRLLLGRLIAVLAALERFATPVRRAALPGLHPLPAGPAHHGGQARHAVDAGLCARRRGAVATGSRRCGSAAARAPPAPRRRFSSSSAAITRRFGSWTGGWPAKLGFDRAVSGDRADLHPEGRQRRARHARAASPSRPPSWPATSGCSSTRASCSSRSSRSRSAPAPWRTSAIRCARSGSAAWRGS